MYKQENRKGRLRRGALGHAPRAGKSRGVKTATMSLFLANSPVLAKGRLITLLWLCIVLACAMPLSSCAAHMLAGEKLKDMKIGAGVVAAASGGAGDSTQNGGGTGSGNSRAEGDRTKAEDNTGASGGEGGGANGNGAGGRGEGALIGAAGGAGENTAGTKNGGAADSGDAPPEYRFTQAELGSMSAEKIGWGVKLNGNLQPEVASGTRKMFEKYNAAYIGSPDEPVIYLTFDLGYENGNTETVLDILDRRGISAAFFITGHYLSTQPDIVGRIIADGHIVANHSLNHTVFPDDSDDELIADVRDLESAYFEATGIEINNFIRPPNGEYSERSLAITASLGYRTILWSFAFVDYDENQFFTIEYAYKKIMDNLHNGAVILLHTIHQENAFALDRVITKALEDGYTFSTLDKLPYSNS